MSAKKVSFSQHGMLRKKALAAVACLSCLSVGMPAMAATQQTVTDSSGTAVAVPAPSQIHAIGDAWPAHLEVLSMLGAGSKVVSYVNVDTPEKRPWLAVVNPQMKLASPAFTKTDVNVEEMLKDKPDVVFSIVTPRMRTKLQELNIPNVQLTFTNFKELEKTFDLTAKILGPDAQKRADDFNAYLEEKLQQVRSYTSTLPESEKPRVLHVVHFNPLTIDGGHSLIDAWIKAAGGVNVAEDVHGSLKVTSKEQMLAWNPDVIIFGGSAMPDPATRASELKALESDPMWASVNAVKHHQVYINPNGAFLWDRYGAETVLQVQWAAKTLHPEHFKNLDMAKETKSFYHRFLNYDLTDKQVNEILQDLPPKTL